VGARTEPCRHKAGMDVPLPCKIRASIKAALLRPAGAQLCVLCCAGVSFTAVQNTFPDLMQFVKIRVVEMLDHVLATYNPRAGEYTAKLWKRQGEWIQGEKEAPCPTCSLASRTTCCKHTSASRNTARAATPGRP
jgi:hypothetical protein